MADTYLMAFRAVVACDDDVQAQMIAEVIRSEGEKHLDPDDGDELFIAQVTPYIAAVEPMELVDRLLRARNDLIKTRVKQCWDVAKQLDQVIWGLQNGLEPHMESSYPHGRFIDVATAILERGEYPL